MNLLRPLSLRPVRWPVSLPPVSRAVAPAVLARSLSSQCTSSSDAVLTPGSMFRLLHDAATAPVAEAEAAVHDYPAAVQKLFTLQTPIKERTATPDPLADMSHYLSACELDVSTLSVVHVAGTKGKGSTCAFVESILRSRGYSTGLFTSPHLIEARERIRLDGVPISPELFARHFWRVWDVLSTTPSPHPTIPQVPGFFRFLCVVSFSVFLEQRPDVVVLEVGLGGRLDGTNIIPAPVVCGITSLGYDHCNVLGHRIEQIAYEKAGIIKPSVPVVSAPQPVPAIDSLQRRCREVGASLQLAPPLAQYIAPGHAAPKLGLSGWHQELNAALAMALAQHWLARHAAPPPAGALTSLEDLVTVVQAAKPIPADAPPIDQDAVDVAGIPHAPVTTMSAEDVHGLQACYWPGRGQTLPLPNRNMVVYLDGAHTQESMRACVDWYLAASASSRPISPVIAGAASAEAGGASTAWKSQQPLRFLLFNCTGDRDPATLLRLLEPANDQFEVALFCPNLVSKLSKSPGAPPASTAWQEREAAAWAAQTGQPCPARVHASLESALSWLLEYEAAHPHVQMQVLVTGSVHLVGGTLAVLEQLLQQKMCDWD